MGHASSRASPSEVILMSSNNNSGHRFKKRFGQNFLQDPNYIQQIIESCNLQKTDHVIEIGPGSGALTEHIYNSVDRFTIIEIDNDLVTKLKDKYDNSPSVTLVHMDVLKVDFSSISIKDKAKVIGNLPYNISTPLLFRLFENIELFSGMFFMLQKEVALRLASEPGSKEYGRLTIMANCFCDIEILFTVPNTAFYPPPKVESAIVHFKPKEDLLSHDVDLKLLNDIVTKSFSARRKTITNALKGIFTEDDLSLLGISPMSRPEQISVNSYVNMALLLQKRLTK